jgi:signal transduction histidine kinase
MIGSVDILKASILIVDDQEAHSSLLEQTLRGAGYVSITVTNNPREVCELHRKNHYSLILLDLLMPGLDGFQVMEGLKAIDTGGYLAILVLTAQPDQKLRALKAGAKDFVSKPFDLSEVSMRVHNMLEIQLLHRDAETRMERAEARSELSETANLAKNQFLANMSHELRTPLNGIIGFTEFLMDGNPGPLQPKQKEYLGDVLNSARHLLQLINDVLDLAKVDAGKMELRPEIFAVHKAVGEVAAVIKGIAQKKHIAVRIDIGAGLDAVMLDQRKFKQVLYNLLSNAVKFSDDGSRVDIRARRLDEHQLEVQVRDTGIGIKTEDINRLFTEFEQLDSGITRRFEGTGLGLALTKKFIEFQGGHIRVESELGKGSVFTVLLPVMMMQEGKAA